jgi:hypothetical protein
MVVHFSNSHSHKYLQDLESLRLFLHTKPPLGALKLYWTGFFDLILGRDLDFPNRSLIAFLPSAIAG